MSNTYSLPVTRSNDSYTERWVSPANFRLYGTFKHNPHHPFSIVLHDTEENARDWSGSTLARMARENVIGSLGPMNVVIDGQKKNFIMVNVQNGDTLELFDSATYETIASVIIDDHIPLHNPVLYRA